MNKRIGTTVKLLQVEWLNWRSNKRSVCHRLPWYPLAVAMATNSLPLPPSFFSLSIQWQQKRSSHRWNYTQICLLKRYEWQRRPPGLRVQFRCASLTSTKGLLNAVYSHVEAGWNHWLIRCNFFRVFPSLLWCCRVFHGGFCARLVSQ